MNFTLLDNDTIKQERYTCKRILYDNGRTGGYISEGVLISGDVFIDKDTVIAGDDIVIDGTHIFKRTSILIDRGSIMKLFGSSEITDTKIAVYNHGTVEINSYKNDIKIDNLSVYFKNKLTQLYIYENVDIDHATIRMTKGSNSHIIISNAKLSGDVKIDGHVNISGKGKSGIVDISGDVTIGDFSEIKGKTVISGNDIELDSARVVNSTIKVSQAYLECSLVNCKVLGSAVMKGITTATDSTIIDSDIDAGQNSIAIYKCKINNSVIHPKESLALYDKDIKDSF